MLRTILIGIDGSQQGDVALELAMRWARRFDARLVGIGCIDDPRLDVPERHVVGRSLLERFDAGPVTEMRDRIEQALATAADRCAKSGVVFEPREVVGAPDVQITKEAERQDLIVLARDTHFRFGWHDQPDPTLSQVLARTPRPVVAVPRPLVGGDTVLVAYDGSLQAARALASFEASGLGQGCQIRAVTVANREPDAARRAARAVAFLKSHGLDATPEPIASGQSPAAVILEVIQFRDPDLVVMGAYGQPILREFFIGSTTRAMLQECPVPMFLDR